MLRRVWAAPRLTLNPFPKSPIHNLVCPRFRGRLMTCALSAAGGSSRS